MSMQEFILEMKTIRQELDTMRKKGKALKGRYNVLERQVISMLKEKEQLGVKMNDQAITINDKEKKLFNPKKKQETDIVRLLEENGVRDAKDVFVKMEGLKVRERLNDSSLKFTSLKRK